MTLVRFNHATLGYPRRTVIDGVTFDLRREEICCLLGANGCGKTTLIRTLLGLLPPLGGEILLAGKPVGDWSPADRAAVMAWVPQAHDGPFAFQALDMVLMGCSVHMSVFSSPGRRERELARHTLDTLGIGHLEHRVWATLSGGERQLVLIARALVQRPRLLLLDEPAASLDFGHQITLLNTIRQLRARGMTLLMATHHPMHARAVADRVVLIAPPGTVSQGPPETMLSCEALAALYHVQPEEIRRHLGTEQWT
ncbi:ABC transporter ATP-binding protein [Affinibrenneria salicis]|uniref:ABC transporter ATP-binding protein n=1 Tax=Affinibrenneria salicis TaxID=2590031 RepID=A0A5J5G7K0_9GAMM|nr:ABC transporter ATP-binding protein [Affinibrenneria salicis]KAA9002553.1 ABC transporter ATP-binding protein [Affinibrenneria salicis]KAA9003159.1 ABC transporter ATP-binding protein [Affinibrenneria salicis]